MGKKGRDRSSRRREFGDDAFDAGDTRGESPRQSFRRPSPEDKAPAGPAIEATVKWFNAEKGFGFVELGDRSGDAFMHIAVLQKAGHEEWPRKQSCAFKSVRAKKVGRSPLFWRSM